MNFSMIMYPSKTNFDAWSALGNDGWMAADLAPYLRKFHTYTPAGADTKTLLSLDYMNERTKV